MTNDAAEPGSGAAPDRRGKVLIIEDDHLVALELETVLTEAGFTVVGVAASASEALDLARNGKPQVAVTDIKLAGPRDGVDVALELYRELGIRSIFASAHSDNMTQERAKASRPYAWIAKPYHPDGVLRAVHAAIESL